MKNLTLSKIILFLFVLFTLGDIVTTVMVMSKHSVYSQESETSPLAVLGIPLWLLIVIKILAVILLLWFFLKKYHTPNIYLRYILVYFLVLFVLLYAGMIVNNLKWFNKPTEEIKPLPKEERIPVYIEQVGDMKVIENITPKPEGFRIPLVFSMLIFNILVFAVWLSFEKEHFGGWLE